MSDSRPSPTHVLALASLLVVATALPGRVQAQDHAGMHASAAVTDSAAVAAAVHTYHEALRAGDTATVRTLLAEDVRIAESGGLETREEYLSHHLPGDMAFAAAVTREPGPIHVTVAGDVAWAISAIHTTGTVRDRAINSTGAELMVLSRDGDQWRIRAIHWSSRQVR